MDWHTKKYGRITGGDMERCLQIFGDVWLERQSWSDLAKDEEKATKFLRKLMTVPNWTVFYNDSLATLIAKIAIVSGVSDGLLAAAQSNDPVGEVMKLVDGLPDEPPEHPASMPLAFAMVGNLDAIAMYSRSINDMLVASKGGEIEALFNALSVDSYISTMPFFQALLKLGQLSGDSTIAQLVFNSLKGPHKKRFEYPELRWAEYLLRDQNAFNSCSREEIYELVVEHLRLYDATGAKEDAKAALFKLFRAWQRQAGIQNPRFGFSAKRK